MNHRCESCAAEDVIAEVARAHSRQLAVVAQHEGLTAEDALDAVQEALSRYLLLRREREIPRDPEEVRALLIAIVRNEARNMRRRHHRAIAHDDVTISGLATSAPTTVALLEAEEDRARLIGCLRQLPDRERAVVTMRMLEELSGTDAGLALGLTPGHVAVLLHRARRELYQCMCGEEVTGSPPATT